MERTSVLRLAAAIGGFELFLAAVEIAGLCGLLDGDVPLTVFAPTDAAFGSLSDALLTQLLARHAANLEPFIRAHLVAGVHCGRAMTGLGRLRSMAGEALDVDALLSFAKYAARAGQVIPVRQPRQPTALGHGEAQANPQCSVDGGVLVVSGAVVVSPDLYATNGVLHAIDQVLSSDGRRR